MRIRCGRRTATTILLLACAGCTDPADRTVGAAGFGVNGAGKLAVYNGGLDRSAGDSPCLRDGRHRQFDFWVGGWSIGFQRSLIRSLLDGCMIEENYMPAPPPAQPGAAPGPVFIGGRSINAYDRDTGTWRQTWVSPSPRGHLRLSGGLEDGIMKMAMRAGSFYTEFHWEAIGPDAVVQSFGPTGTEISLLYERLDGVTLAEPRATGLCRDGTPIPGGELNRQADFIEGDWDVSTTMGPLGIARVRQDMDGCLMREDFTTPKGFASHSWLYYDANSRLWHRTYIDSEAERVELAGSPVNGALVLRGVEAGPEGAFRVRNTFRPGDAGTVIQTWETSRDGIDWATDMTLTYRPR